MRVVEDAAGLAEKVDAARREAGAAFGRDDVFLERLVEQARHLEVQILADDAGQVVHLYERDCTVQRRHQKVVERAPAAALDPAAREEMCAAAVRLAREAGYRNAGTNVAKVMAWFCPVRPLVCGYGTPPPGRS